MGGKPQAASRELVTGTRPVVRP